MDIVAKGNVKAKGQAFIVYDNVDSATEAMNTLQGFELFDKEILLQYAKSRSDVTVRRVDGEEGLEQHKRHRLAEKGTRGEYANIRSIAYRSYRTQTSHRSGCRED